ncbi:hypothetical protein EZJ43_07725 [Pedobacter changchengzhani]|uniref:Uncharacterized protein n=1 Tax=Pedobacter changchengzhani TaxID=2529274 RepID=A0A4R5ML95_9SPHI|nr:hypothetical protein [Pedobacter changchengzhani]TDG36398.1 hypothetical protein EZJ43_07725 [Pedobacter changchengzhani]
MKLSMSFLLTVLGLQSCNGQEVKTLPAEFEEYSLLNANLKSDKFEVVLLAKAMIYMSPHPIRLFYCLNNVVILEEERESDTTNGGNCYSKLDENANVLDSIYVPAEGGEATFFIREYMIHTRTKGDCEYTTWPLNGDKTSKKMAILNEDLTWPEEKVIAEQEKLIAKADYYFYDISYFTNTNDQSWSLQKLFYCTDGKWQILYRPFPKTIYLDADLKYSRYRDDFYRSSNDAQEDFATQKFTLKYYHKEKKLKYEHSIGGGSQSSSVKGWIGTGYIDIPLLNDTLKIKQSHFIVEEATPAIPKTRYFLSNGEERAVSPFNINIFKDPKLNYALYSDSKYRVYAIRKKQK